MSYLKAMANSRKVKRLTGLGSCSENPDQMIIAVAKTHKSRDVEMIIFSDNIGNNNGKTLANFIVEHHLGGITETGRLRNPNNDNTIEGWIWTINKPELAKWKEKEIRGFIAIY